MDDAVFPIELFQLVIDHLSDLESGLQACGRVSPTLQDCSLVCKAFVPLCRCHLFRDICLGIHNNASISRSRLIEALESSPSLSSYIKRVKYRLYTDEEHNQYDAKCHQPLSVYEGGYSASLHELLPAIHSLSFNWHERSFSEDNDSDRSTRACSCCEEQIDSIELFNAILKDFAGSPAITSFEIMSFEQEFLHIGLQDILVFPSLRILKSCGTGWKLSNILIQRPTHLPLHLKSLDLSLQQGFPIKILEYCPDIEQVRNLQSVLASISLQDVSTIIPKGLKKVATYTKLRTVHVNNITFLASLCDSAEMLGVIAFPALDQLTVCFFTWYCRVDEASALHRVMRHAPNLRSLSLTNLSAFTDLYYSVIKFDQCFQGCGATLEHMLLSYRSADKLGHRCATSIPMLCDTLSYMKTQNRLKTIYLYLNIIEGRVDDWMKMLVQEWQRLDTALTANGGCDFEVLSKITVHVNVEGSKKYDTHTHLPKFRATLQGGWAQLLPLLHANFDASISYPKPLSWIHKLVLRRRELALQ